jgi:hypothetical protein
MILSFSAGRGYSDFPDSDAFSYASTSLKKSSSLRSDSDFGILTHQH